MFRHEVRGNFRYHLKGLDDDQIYRLVIGNVELSHPLPGYPFCRTERADHPGRPFGWPQPDETDKAYWDGIWKLADSIASQLKRMEYAAARTAVSAGARASAESVPARVGRTLFLGYMHDSLQRERQALRAQLDEAGFKIVPPTSDDPVDEPTVRSAFETYVPGSDAITLIANQNSELWPKGQDGGPLGLQFQRQAIPNSRPPLAANKRPQHGPQPAIPVLPGERRS